MLAELITHEQQLTLLAMMAAAVKVEADHMRCKVMFVASVTSSQLAH
jgi:hypothetical protein